MASGEDIFSVMQACILLSWYFYQEGRWVEVWIFAAFQTRVAVPLRLNYPGTFSTHGNNSPGAYLAPPKDLRDLESRRRTWWMTIIFDRIASVGGWIHAVDERDIGTELPWRTVDFESEVCFRPFLHKKFINLITKFACFRTILCLTTSRIYLHLTSLPDMRRILLIPFSFLSKR